MRIGLAQMDIVWEEKVVNIQKAEKMIQDAVKNQIDYLLFPEMSLTGFSMNTNLIGEEDTNRKTLEVFAGFGKQYDIFIGIGYVEKRTDKAFNRYAIISPSGEILVDYVKIHPFSYGEEGIYYTGGERIEYANIRNIQTVPFICYDLRFPEIFQLASKNAHLITISANWPMERREHWITLLKARAIENQCYIAGVNRIGDGNGLYYSGDSMIIDPYGEILSKPIEGEGIVIAEIDKNIVESCRESFRLKEDRKEELYIQLFRSIV